VGDNRHLTFFEMFGNWSLGSYFQEDAIKWSFEFLTDREKGLGLDPNRLYVTVFKGEDGIPRDEKSIEIWKKVFDGAGIKADVAGEDEIIRDNVRIIPLGKDDNFWIAGDEGPCGGDTEMFYDVSPEIGKLDGKFSDLVGAFRIIEIWNDVFMEFNKTADGRYEPLAQKNIVDTGMGLERTLTVVNNQRDIFQTDVFSPIITEIERLSQKKYSWSKETFNPGKPFNFSPNVENNGYVNRDREMRIIADHIKASVFIINDGVAPSNKDHGYIVRRLIRRAIVKAHQIGIKDNFTSDLAESVFEIYENVYDFDKARIKGELEKEESKFRLTLEKGLKESEKLYNKKIGEGMEINGDDLFNLYSTYGFPIEISLEEIDRLRKNNGLPPVPDYVKKVFNEAFKKHQELSRTASAGQFKGGLADASDEVRRLHTAAHLMLAALRQVLGEHVQQKGSNITAERLRFDFSHPQKMTPEEIKKVEDIVNEQISKKLPVQMKEMTVDEAKAEGATGVFEHKYGDKVKVYTIGGFSKEICGGPHANNTGELGTFKIVKEEASSAGIRRIKAVLGS
jgi:alanyl-tRNA synthetase